jgi:O-succinylbenzoic acid--CoA ligase
VVPAQLVRLLEDPSSLPRSLKAVMLGGASSPASLRRAAVARGIPVFTTYGMTETASQVATGPADAVDDGSPVGPPLPGIHVTIDATEPGTAGEIVIEGPVLARAVVANGVRTPLARPHRSRDAGFIDAHGRLHVIGRLDAVINSGGRKIHPEAIERVIMSVPGIRAACVTAVAHLRWGQRPVAFVDAGVGSAHAIAAALRTGLAAHEVPDALLRMPLDEAGLMKPSRVRLAARLAAGEQFEELR